MLFKTLASKLSGEKRWLRQWKEEDKKDGSSPNVVGKYQATPFG